VLEQRADDVRAKGAITKAVRTKGTIAMCVIAKDNREKGH